VSQRVPRDEARRRITAAAGRLLEDRRFRELTVEAVMEEAELSRTVFYRHFDSLADVVVSLLDEAVAEAAEIAITAPDPSVPEVLRAMLARGVELWARHGHLLAAVEEAAHHDPEVERIFHQAFERSVETTAALLAQGVANGHYVVEPWPVARAMTHLNAGYLSETLAREPHGDRDEALRTLWTVWARMLGLENARGEPL
jgi:TetR/AcrR family transcriptional regulator, ethionamide resistance regulator